MRFAVAFLITMLLSLTAAADESCVAKWRAAGYEVASSVAIVGTPFTVPTQSAELPGDQIALRFADHHLVFQPHDVARHNADDIAAIASALKRTSVVYSVVTPEEIRVYEVLEPGACDRYWAWPLRTPIS